MTSCASNPIVTNTNDSGAGSLRDAILSACSGDTITFNIPTSDPGFNGGVYTITLTTTQLTVSNAVTISGPGAEFLTISGNTAHRVVEVTVASPGVVTLTGLTIANGSADGVKGGGIRNSAAGTVNVINSTVRNNSTHGDGSSGGVGGGAGIFNSTTGTINITNSIIRANSLGPQTQGSGILNMAGTVNVTSSTFSNNGTQDIKNSGTFNLTNSTISLDADGIVSNGTLNITNSTIGCNPSGFGYGIANLGSDPISIRNSIVARNKHPGGVTSDILGPFITQGHNLIGTIDSRATGFTVGTNNANGDLVGTFASPVFPLLGSLANNGGPTQTLALLPGSPAIDAGDNCVTDAAHCGDANVTQLTTDQRGFNRLVNTTVDIGAFEARGFAITATSGTSQSAVITTNFSAPLVATVSSAAGDPVAGGMVNFTAPTSGPSVYFVSANKTTVTLDANGIATSPTLTANATAGGPYNVIAVGNGITSPASFSLANTKATPANSVTSSVNPADLGQSVTFTATVTSGAGTPTGAAQFKDNGAIMGGPVTLNASGVAQMTTSSLTAGTHAITSDYIGDANFTPSTGTLAGGQIVRSQPSLSINDVSITEGDSGTKTLTFTVTLSVASNLTVTASYATANGTATAPSDYAAIPTTTLTFNPGETTKTIGVTINGDQAFEADETLVVNLSSPSNATINKAQGTGTILNDDAQGGIISFSQATYSGSESAGFITITVNRNGDTSNFASVDYATNDAGAPTACATVNGLASSRCDFTTTMGTLKFGAGETQKTFLILTTRDSFTEGSEMFTVNLSNLTGGAAFGTPASTTVSITDNTTGVPANAIDDASIFVRQHYHDFLSREPDAAGLAFWTNQITSCGADAQCLEIKRINVSAAFYLSIEFQETGYLVERLYKTAYGDVLGTSNFGGTHQLAVPIIRLNEFLPDTQQISQGVVVGVGNWQQQLENNKVVFTTGFVQRDRFTVPYPTFMTPADFVDKLFLNAGVTPSAADHNAAIGEFGVATNTMDTAARGRALRRIAENSTLSVNESNRAFVLMQYFGYLRRNPNDTPDSDYTGYDFWLTKLNQFNGNFVNAEMVKAFINAGEYRQRFGP